MFVPCYIKPLLLGSGRNLVIARGELRVTARALAVLPHHLALEVQMWYANAVAEPSMKILNVDTRHFCDCELVVTVCFHLSLHLELRGERALQLLSNALGLMGDAAADSGGCRLHLHGRELADFEQLVAALSNKSTQRISKSGQPLLLKKKRKFVGRVDGTFKLAEIHQAAAVHVKARDCGSSIGFRFWNDRRIRVSQRERQRCGR